MPANWNEAEIKAFHQDIGGDASHIRGCKLLHQRQGLSSRAAIVKYVSQEAAQYALNLCRGSTVNMEVRFAEEKGGKGGPSWGGSRNKDGAIPVHVGLRVKNHANGHSGEVVACRGRTPGTFRVLFDNGQEWEWEVKRFVTEDGWPLQDDQTVPATIGMRVRCWMDNRSGRIAYIHNDWPQRIWVEFDDGEENEKDVTWFVSEHGGNPVGPGMTEREWRFQKGGGGGSSGGGGGAKAHSHNDHYDNWDYRWQQSHHRDPPRPSGGPGKGKDMRPPVRSNRWDEPKGKPDRYASKGSERPAGKGDKGKSPGKSAPVSAPKKIDIDPNEGTELEQVALGEVIDQLLDESNAGRVWITNWPGRFQAKLGQLRDFLERHPDKFTVIPQGGRRYTVAFAGSAPEGGKERQDRKERSKPSKKMEWKRSQKTASKEEGAAEAAGEGDEKEETSKSAKSKRSAEEDADATAFDAAADEDPKDHDEPKGEDPKAETA